MARWDRLVRIVMVAVSAGVMLQPAMASTASAAVDTTDELQIVVTHDGDTASIRASIQKQATAGGFSGADRAAGRGLTSQGRAAANGPAARSEGPTPVCTNEVGGLDFILATPPPPEMVDPYLVNQLCKINGIPTLQGSGVFWRDRVAANAAAAVGAPAPAPTPAITDVDIRRYAEDFLVPELVIRHNPEGYALTGIETWFWVEGWDGVPVIETVDVLGFPVLVELRLASVAWDFGDGTVVQTTDLGRAYPDKTGTTHVYTDRSTVDGDQAAFTATSTVTIDIEVSIAGSPLVALQPFSRTQTVPIVVREAQALLE